ncbi:MAG: hypothetical protein IKS11_09285 [Lachnospiraceae bacterium]|nr:hypothetical protein [Lachnospiraceae bacterium]
MVESITSDALAELSTLDAPPLAPAKGFARTTRVPEPDRASAANTKRKDIKLKNNFFLINMPIIASNVTEMLRAQYYNKRHFLCQLYKKSLKNRKKRKSR